MKAKCSDQLPKTPFLPENDFYDIPYGTLVPQKIDNLLISGRCISATHIAMASSRVIGTCFAIGEAAGTAAAVALDEQCIPRQLAPQKVQAALKKNGVPL